ncbi:MAG: hypothetical protein COY38_00465 [Candidatus Aenigmarchaeota archaeon CG_4_10_14_0_8_um_filter_37_24]|nr:hypothetical protein [Candidatus Aenigmarchaeota archaeon]OIN85441.1 MAG: hypothetical protein AUJ50_05130 [Candidatus Aenigmarchaeota archaeon CG1_02_38_14]PIV68332.1 MAG: hypothetical protein COS07_04415 [Candidatus Aenigmarchaeota archaeon CG01_land_8_20_14_3_00_37_9]PIW40924.1 MAG: hypothetical protein COW21_04625 [Candidatus Aenigmarchaeota archaeon CG15_BIG_FIL_POST_REV_8_21_14_020_37_27]PIX50304.1 MAG: hypothetical protein COZ52_04750 [Candidatus Aenigmarchaeota archaeon CG_4_8_14_3_u
MRREWSVERIFSQCVFISNDLGKILQREFPNSRIYTTRSDDRIGERIIYQISHQVSVIRLGGCGFVALDATRPFYDGGEYWILEAGSEGELLRKLSEHYTGNWRLNQIYDVQNSRYLEI